MVCCISPAEDCNGDPEVQYGAVAAGTSTTPSGAVREYNCTTGYAKGGLVDTWHVLPALGDHPRSRALVCNHMYSCPNCEQERSITNFTHALL
jgi:hypothetical protein